MEDSALDDSTLALVEEYQLSNNWRVSYSLNRDYPAYLFIIIERNNGGRWERELSGHIKRDHCCTWNQIDLWHFCGWEDTKLLTIVFDKALELLGPEDGE